MGYLGHLRRVGRLLVAIGDFSRPDERRSQLATSRYRHFLTATDARQVSESYCRGFRGLTPHANSLKLAITGVGTLLEGERPRADAEVKSGGQERL